MSYADVQPIFQPTDKIVAKLGLGEIDAVFSANPVMLTAARALSQTVPLRLLPIGRTVINRLRGSYPFLRPVTVAANQLPGRTGRSRRSARSGCSSAAAISPRISSTS